MLRKKPHSRSRENTRANLQKSLRFEALEDRALMAANITFNATTGVFYVEGTDTTKDTVDVKIDTRGTTSTADDLLTIKMTSVGSNSTSTRNFNWTLSSVKKIVFNGYGMDDKFDNNSAVASELDGGAGNDILLGGTGKDVIYGGDGNDYIDGRAGNDTLYGSGGNDVVFGDKGNDLLYGGSGNDKLYGGAGADSIWGEAGTDWLDGGADTELKMIGGTEVDTFVDDTKSYPGGDVTTADKQSTTHDSLALFDYNVANDATRSAQRLAAFLGSSTTTTTTTTTTTPTTNLNSQILAYALANLGKKIGDGECTRLVEGALASAGAQPGSNFSQPGFYVWGRKLAANEAKTPGDIIQFAPGTRFESANSFLQMGSTSGHVGIIESINGNTITLLNQNMAGSPVIRTVIDLSTIKAGSFSVYRAIPK